MLLITGAAGFIGGNFVNRWYRREPSRCEPVVVLDLLTYAGLTETLAVPLQTGRCELVRGDIGDAARVAAVLAKHRPRAVIHFAAETHVDRSIAGPARFVHTNLLGTFVLLEAVRGFWSTLTGGARDDFRFLHISTDEVFGSLAPGAAPVDEHAAFAPNNPYAASKAGSDHLVRSCHRTWGLPTLMIHCSNNYGPYQFPEKLIPKVISNALEGQPLPVYGDGRQSRDWIHVDDHCEAIGRVLESGTVGETYNVGGGNELRNIDLVTTICRRLDILKPRRQGPHEALISFVEDRPGHDRRYAIDSGRIRRELGWTPAETLEDGLDRTLRWYLANGQWLALARANAVRRSPPGGNDPSPAGRA